jgi:hypothetical protein
VIDHVTDWLGKEMELPPFPHDTNKENNLIKSLELKNKLYQ